MAWWPVSRCMQLLKSVGQILGCPIAYLVPVNLLLQMQIPRAGTFGNFSFLTEQRRERSQITWSKSSQSWALRHPMHPHRGWMAMAV
mmetsp:Transcript_6582/g.18620  ORF Transcript_6582/g.18620 Transcript_6582/m.18620 type:complete len:87 (-) Transcript_6582:426-686(-)